MFFFLSPASRDVRIQPKHHQCEYDDATTKIRYNDQIDNTVYTISTGQETE